MKIITAVSLMFILLIGCTEKKDEKTFFTQGKKVKSGLIWNITEKNIESVIKDKKLNIIFSDDFNREELGKDYTSQGGDWQIKDNMVHSMKAYNKNLVLNKVLPENGMIELKIMSKTPFFDGKINAWGDGKRHDHGDGYTAILGGWKGQISVISKLHEHEVNRTENRKTKFTPDKIHTMKFIKDSNKLYLFIDDKIVLARWDDKPLSVKDGYKYFSFANWKSDLWFDDLKVYSFD